MLSQRIKKNGIIKTLRISIITPSLKIKCHKFPASKVLDFKSFDDLDSWRIYGEEYLEKHWNKLYFCMRYKKNIMPLDKKSYDNHKFKKLISPWTKHFKGKKGEKKYRGALHVRVG